MNIYYCSYYYLLITKAMYFIYLVKSYDGMISYIEWNEILYRMMASFYMFHLYQFKINISGYWLETD